MNDRAEDVGIERVACGEASEVEIDTDQLTVRGCRSWPQGTMPFKVTQSDGSQVAVLTRSLHVLATIQVSVRFPLPLVLAAQTTLEIAGAVREPPSRTRPERVALTGSRTRRPTAAVPALAKAWPGEEAEGGRTAAPEEGVG